MRNHLLLNLLLDLRGGFYEDVIRHDNGPGMSDEYIFLNGVGTYLKSILISTLFLTNLTIPPQSPKTLISISSRLKVILNPSAHLWLLQH